LEFAAATFDIDLGVCGVGTVGWGPNATATAVTRRRPNEPPTAARLTSDRFDT
jgi:hypothetical protein